MGDREVPWWATDPDEKPVPLVLGAGPPTPHSGEATRHVDSGVREREVYSPLTESDDDEAIHPPRSVRQRWVPSTAPWAAGGRLTRRAAVGGAATVVLVVGCVQMFGAGWRYGSAVAEKLSSTSSTTAAADSSQETVTGVTSMVHVEESRSRGPLPNDLKRTRKREVRRQR
jgi:hypothetical protein